MRDFGLIWLSCLGPLILLLPQTFTIYLAFLAVGFERVWWRLFQKRIVCQFDKKKSYAICDILWLHLSSFASIFLDWQKMRCLLTFELMDLILAYEFSGYFVIFIVHYISRIDWTYKNHVNYYSTIKKKWIQSNLKLYIIAMGAVVVMIVWWLDLQLPVQSAPITTKVVSSNPTQARCTRIWHYPIEYFD